MSSGGTKRRRRTSCDGGACGSPTCTSCRLHSDDNGVDTERKGRLNVNGFHERRTREQAGPVFDRRPPPKSQGLPSATLVVDLTDDDDGGSANRQSELSSQPSRSPAKRVRDGRAFSGYNAVSEHEPGFREMVEALDEETVRHTLIRLASMAPSAQTVIRQAYTQHVRDKEKPSEPIDFDQYSKKSWHALHTSDAAKRWAALDEVRRISATSRALETVLGHVSEMRSQIRETTPFDAKLNALETMRKILKSVLLGSNELAGAVRSQLARRGGLGDDVVIVLMCMTEDEMIRAGGTADEKGTLAQKFRWCRDEARKYGLVSLKGLDTVVEMMGMSLHGNRWD
ncbi:hypothetical protein AB5N19_13592 [Seiridium cardinale]